MLHRRPFQTAQQPRTSKTQISKQNFITKNATDKKQSKLAKKHQQPTFSLQTIIFSRWYKTLSYWTTQAKTKRTNEQMKQDINNPLLKKQEQLKPETIKIKRKQDSNSHWPLNNKLGFGPGQRDNNTNKENEITRWNGFPETSPPSLLWSWIVTPRAAVRTCFFAD